MGITVKSDGAVGGGLRFRNDGAAQWLRLGRRPVQGGGGSPQFSVFWTPSGGGAVGPLSFAPNSVVSNFAGGAASYLATDASLDPAAIVPGASVTVSGWSSTPYAAAGNTFFVLSVGDGVGYVASAQTADGVFTITSGGLPSKGAAALVVMVVDGSTLDFNDLSNVVTGFFFMSPATYGQLSGGGGGGGGNPPSSVTVAVPSFGNVYLEVLPFSGVGTNGVVQESASVYLAGKTNAWKPTLKVSTDPANFMSNYFQVKIKTRQLAVVDQQGGVTAGSYVPWAYVDYLPTSAAAAATTNITATVAASAGQGAAMMDTAQIDGYTFPDLWQQNQGGAAYPTTDTSYERGAVLPGQLYRVRVLIEVYQTGNPTLFSSAETEISLTAPAAPV